MQYADALSKDDGRCTYLRSNCRRGTLSKEQRFEGFSIVFLISLFPGLHREIRYIIDGSVGVRLRSLLIGKSLDQVVRTNRSNSCFLNDINWNLYGVVMSYEGVLETFTAEYERPPGMDVVTFVDHFFFF